MYFFRTLKIERLKIMILILILLMEKSVKYHVERLDIISKIDNILQLDSAGGSFETYNERLDKVKDLFADIKSYFRVSDWGCYSRRGGIRGVSPAVIIKYIYLEMGHEVEKIGSKYYIARKSKVN